ncbi:MAG: class I SAM-dependent methyltransferase [Planctomycetota bacterium]
MKDRLLMRWRPRICPFHILMDYVPQGSSVLDIGCGSGLWLFLLSRFGRISRGTGVELSQRKVDMANSMKGPDDNLEFRILKLNDKWPEEPCDCLTMIDVLHHVPLSRQKDFLSRLQQTKTKRIVLKDLDPKAKAKSFMNLIHDILLSRQLPKYCEKEKVVEWLEQIGFSISHCGRYDVLWYSHYLIVAERK